MSWRLDCDGRWRQSRAASREIEAESLGEAGAKARRFSNRDANAR